MNDEFEPTHKLKGSGYELVKTSVFDDYRDKYGNQLRLDEKAVTPVTLPEPADGTLWRDDVSEEDYLYCKPERKFYPLKNTINGVAVPVESYETKFRRMTQMYLYENSYPAGRVLQDVLDNFGTSNKPQVEIYWDYGRVKVVLSTRYPDRSWSGTGATVEKAVENLNWNMIE